MTPDVRAAAERFQFHGSDRYPGCFRDASMLAAAYLAEHPADDELGVTEEWLRSVGFAETRDICYGHPILEIGSEDCTLDCDLKCERWHFGSFGLPAQTVPKTRGHVRRLLAALGVPLPAGSPCREGGGVGE